MSSTLEISINAMLSLINGIVPAPPETLPEAVPGPVAALYFKAYPDAPPSAGTPYEQWVHDTLLMDALACQRLVSTKTPAELQNRKLLRSSTWILPQSLQAECDALEKGLAPECEEAIPVKGTTLSAPMSGRYCRLSPGTQRQFFLDKKV